MSIHPGLLKEKHHSYQNRGSSPGSDKQRPIACLNTSYKWFTSCLLDPTDQHLEEHGLMEGSQRGAKKGCRGTVDDLFKQ